MTRIAVDALGGDNGPEVLIEGSLRSLKKIDSDLILVGDKDLLSTILKRHRYPLRRVEIVHAPDVVGMHVKAKDSLRMRKSSISVSVDLAKSGEVSAVVSAGNTGAASAATLVKWRTLEGISRPAIGELFPTQKTPCFFLDVGATIDCKARNLMDFAVMGAAYCRDVLGNENPRIGLLNIGEEPSKGTDITREAYELLEKSSLNFRGNAEGRDILSGQFDVVVCDGFTGNVVLKFGESVAELIISSLRGEIKKSIMMKLGALVIQPAFKSFKKRVDYSEYGGAPLLGLNGTCIICHGASNAKAIANAVIRAEDTVVRDLNTHILELLEQNNNV
jgi:glycerol-3-phosphate acyltransferase PlsX